MIDRSHIGRLLPSHTAAVEAGRLRLFAKATGEDRPEYLDHAAALAAGFSGLPAPPPFCSRWKMRFPIIWDGCA